MIGIQCLRCEHYYGFKRCRAFGYEKEIPTEIYEGSFDHTKPHPKQKDKTILYKETK